MEIISQHKHFKRPNIIADDERHEGGVNMDHRQTIASPIATESKVLEQCQHQAHSDNFQHSCQFPSKPPLKPSLHRKYYTKSVCTKSTASTTYVSSDSEEEEPEDVQVYTYGDDGSYFIASESKSTSCSTLSPDNKISKSSRKNGKNRKRSQNRSPLSVRDGQLSEGRFSSTKREAISADSFRGDMCLYQEEESSLYQLTSEDSCGVSCSDNEDSLPDLDLLIAESSARWKSDVENVVSKSSTAAFMQDSTTIPSALDRDRCAAGSSKAQQRPLLARSTTEPTRNTLSSTAAARRLPSAAAEKLIEEQQVEIERLRSLLHSQESYTEQRLHNYPILVGSNMVYNSVTKSGTPNSSSTSSPSKNSSNSSELARCGFANENVVNNSSVVRSNKSAEGKNRSKDVAPFEHIEVCVVHGEAGDMHDLNSCYWQDDLTVGSSFNYVSAIADKRPDNEDGGLNSIGSQRRKEQQKVR